MAKLVSKVYGDALMQAAREKDKLDAVFEEAKDICLVFQDHQDLIHLLDHPQVVKEEKIQIISNVFQDSADDADVHENIDIRNLQPTNYLSLCCLGVVGLYACPKGTNDNQLICKLPLETALKLADAWGICWEHTSRHFLEYYALA